MLRSLLAQAIQETGPLSQGRFMELALHHPLYGYYRTQEAIARDFTTSPEISQVFGELIGAWAMDFYTNLGAPKNISLVELGPGKGTLLSDFLRISKYSRPFTEALGLFLIEINPLLKKCQQKILPIPAIWAEKLSDLQFPSNPLCIIANEFLDTFPTHYYCRENQVLYERCVDLQGDRLIFISQKRGESLGPDQSWEESQKTNALIHEICALLLRHGGIFLCIDYGYEKGKGDTLQALFQGQPSDPLSHIGKSDLTCHINFGALKKIALTNGLGVLGPIPQGQFLKNLGIDLRIEKLKQANPVSRSSLDIAAMRLTHPQYMGTLFKVMAIFSPSTLNPAGFEQ